MESKTGLSKNEFHNFTILFSISSCDIRYSEGPMALNWANIMKTILEDPDEFFDQGGWKIILEESDHV